MGEGKVGDGFLSDDAVEVVKQQPFLIVSPEGRINGCNKAFCELTGYTEDELKKLRWDLDLTPPEWRQKEAEVLELLCRDGESRVYRKEYLHKNTSRIPVEVVTHAITDRDGRVQHYYAFVTDIALHGPSKKSWRTQRAHFTLLGHMPGIVYRCVNDRKWTMKWIQGDCYRLTGYRAADLIDNKTVAWGDLIHPDDLERTWDVAQVGLQESRPFQQEYRITTADGTEKWVLEQCRGIVNKGEEFFEGFITDITERKRAEEQIRLLLDDYEEMTSDVYNLTSRVVSRLYGIRDAVDKPEVRQSTQKCIEALLCIQSRLCHTRESVKIDFAGYTRLSQEVEFIYDGNDYFYLK